MFVSKKKYDEALKSAKREQEMAGLLLGKNVALRSEIAELTDELEALKASRARSNENLKLGTAASAKARRKKVAGVDWSKPVEAYHPDGRIVRGNVRDPDEDGDREFTERLDSMLRLFRPDGAGWNRNHQWRIRNV